MSDEKKLGDFSRPDSMAFPVDPAPETPFDEVDAASSGAPSPQDPAAWSSEPEPLVTPPPAPSSEPAFSPPTDAPSVDSWGTADDSWQSASWDQDAPPEPVFQPPAAAPDPAAVDFEDPRRSDHSRREGVSPLIVAAVFLVLALLTAAAWWWFMGRAPSDSGEARRATSPLAAPAPPPPAAVAATEPPPKIDLPPLDASDTVVRSLLGTLTDHPQLAKWLVPDDLVRRFVTSVDNVSRGKSPRPHLGVLEPEGGFEIDRRGGLTVAAPASSARYDLLVEVFTSLDIAEGARLYHDVEPLLEEAYQELGDPSRDFRAALTAAIDELLAAPIPVEEPELVKGVLTYRYADPELEALSPAAKHLLRLGPDNARKVQSKLRFFRAALDLPESGS